MANHRARFSWSDLPQELLSEIAIRLLTRTDLFTFRSVCKSWKNSVSQSLLDETKHLLDSVFPYTIVNTINIWKILSKASQSSSYNHYKSVPLVVVPVSIFLLRPATDPTQCPWLVCTEEVNPGKLVLGSPLSRCIYTNLPPAVPTNLDLSSLIVTHLYRAYYIRAVRDNPGVTDKEISKVVLYKNPACVSNPSHENFTLILLHSSGYLVAIRMSDGGNSVHNIRVPGKKHQTKFVDVVNFGGEIYATDRKGVIYTISSYDNLSMKRVPGMRLNLSKKRINWRKKLVESSDENELYMVCGETYRINNKPTRDYNLIIRLYKLDFSRKQLIEVESFGDDKILFMTCNDCFFASVKEFPNWKGNRFVSCVCGFKTSAHCYKEHSDQGKLLTDKGDSILGCEDKSSSFDYSSVFWPPPSWLPRLQR